MDNTLLDLQNSSYPTQPYSIIAKYIYEIHWVQFRPQKIFIRLIYMYRLLHVKSLISFLFTSFLIPYRQRASLWASGRYGIKKEWIKTISIICLLHITCSKKKSSQKVEVKGSVDKFDASLQLEYNVQLDWSNQIITVYLIGPWNNLQMVNVRVSLN